MDGEWIHGEIEACNVDLIKPWKMWKVTWQRVLWTISQFFRLWLYIGNSSKQSTVWKKQPSFPDRLIHLSSNLVNNVLATLFFLLLNMSISFPLMKNIWTMLLRETLHVLPLPLASRGLEQLHKTFIHLYASYQTRTSSDWVLQWNSPFPLMLE